MARLNWPKAKAHSAGMRSVYMGLQDEARARRRPDSPLKIAWEAMDEAKRQFGIAERLYGYGHTDERERHYLMALSTYTEAEAVFVLLKESGG